MNRNWDYAELSKAACKLGGPEMYVNKLEAESLHAGQRDMVPWIGIALLAGVGLKEIGDKIYNHQKIKRAEHNSNLESAKSTLVSVIKDYDASPTANTDANISDITEDTENSDSTTEINDRPIL